MIVNLKRCNHPCTESGQCSAQHNESPVTVKRGIFSPLLTTIAALRVITDDSHSEGVLNSLVVRWKAESSGYQQIAPGWFRPQRLVVRDGDTERTVITFREWQLNSAVPDVFSGTSLDTKSLSVILQGNGGQ
jgi:hypothetical protein